MNCSASRYVVIGVTGAGKSTLAKQLARKLDLTFIELDALHWEKNWQEAPDEVFCSRVEAATRASRWVADGNYHIVRHLLWQRAEVAVWLDYAFPLVFWRLFTRTVRRAMRQQELWNGNRETFWWHLKLWSDESLFRWLFKTYWRRKREYSRLLCQPEYAHLRVIHLRTPNQAEAWLSSLSRECESGSTFAL